MFVNLLKNYNRPSLSESLSAFIEWPSEGCSESQEKTEQNKYLAYTIFCFERRLDRLFER